MKKILFVAIALVVVLLIGYYQYGLFTGLNYFTALSDIKKGKVEILTYGYPLFDDDEANEVAKKYSFQYRTVAGCNVAQRFINQVDSYNAAVVHHLNEVNGEGWEEKLEEDFDRLMAEKNASDSTNAVD